MNYFTINGKSSADFGVGISVGGALNSPSRDVTTVQVLGRNGDLALDNGRFENLQFAYDCYLRCETSAEFRKQFSGFRAWLGSLTGYNRLEDTYNPDEYRMAIISTSLAPEMVGSGVHAANFQVNVNAKPQRFLKSGETTITVSSGDTLHNGHYPSLPLITVYGSGAGAVLFFPNNNGGFGYTLDISDIDEYVTVDCETMDAYKGTENKNSTLNALVINPFPVLESGDNYILFDGGVTSVEIIPRWWTI